MPDRDKLAEFTAWCATHITGDETFRSGTTAQFFLDSQATKFFRKRVNSY